MSSSGVSKVKNLSKSSQSKAITTLLSALRDVNTDRALFATTADRLCHILAEEGLAHFAVTQLIQTPCGSLETLCLSEQTVANLCAVSIIRSGDILTEAVRKIAPGILTGKILIQRDETDPLKRPKLYYSKLPENAQGVILCDPMLATGGSAMCALEVLENKGYPMDKCVFISVVSCPEGLNAVAERFPDVCLISCVVDEKLNADKFIVPGLGDFGDRYFGTD